jgi:TolB protein
VAARSSSDPRPTRSRALRLFILAAVTITVVEAPASATFPGRNGRIAFNAFIERTESLAIYTAKPNGGDVRKLTSLAHTASALPDWSPDGRRIAFYRERLDVHRPVQIYVMNANGSGVTQLTRGPGFHGFPAWSPDAASLAIAADWGDYRDLRGIWIIPASDPGGVTQQEARRLTTLPAGARGEDAEPQFSPDGRSIVFTRAKSPRVSAIFRVRIDGTGLERLTPFSLNASDPDWSPNGQKIAFDSGDAGGRTGGGGNIYVMRADGSGRTKLTDRPQLGRGEPFDLAQNPVWSPSGTRIMFTRFLPNGNRLVAMKPNGSGKHVVIGGRFGKRLPNKVDWGTHP